MKVISQKFCNKKSVLTLSWNMHKKLTRKNNCKSHKSNLRKLKMSRSKIPLLQRKSKELKIKWKLNRPLWNSVRFKPHYLLKLKWHKLHLLISPNQLITASHLLILASLLIDHKNMWISNSYCHFHFTKTWLKKVKCPMTNFYQSSETHRIWRKQWIP